LDTGSRYICVSKGPTVYNRITAGMKLKQELGLLPGLAFFRIFHPLRRKDIALFVYFVELRLLGGSLLDVFLGKRCCDIVFWVLHRVF
jgi:hypothetical protein